MALWRPREPGDISVPEYRKHLILSKLDNLIPRNSFFISDKGGVNGLRIDCVELRQAATRIRPKIAEGSVNNDKNCGM